MRVRGIGLFAAGALVGAFLFYSVAWRTGALVPGHWLTRRSGRITMSSSELPPIPTIPFPTPTPTPGILSTVSQPQAGPGASIFSRGLPTIDVSPLLLPVEGARVANLKDNFDETRGGTRRHEAIDILAPRGTPVVAAVDGTVAKLFTSQAGGLTVYEFDRAGELCYYYAHLDRYAPGLAEGMALKRGDRVGDVGTTGNAPKETPHLHFAMFRLGPDRRWWQGEPVNPYPLLLKAEER